jgi:tetratricopeptide (TPR) repeat protein
MQEHRYRAFLCYSHRDSAWADWLHDALETYAVPPRLVGLSTSTGRIPAHLRPVFRDRDELPSASDLSAKVRDALVQSACLIVICSPHAAQSRWVDEEVRTFQRLGRGDRVYCLIVDGEPGASAWPGREHDECLPAALKPRAEEDAANPEIIEPIAADARPEGDGKANAKLKLIAGMLGVGLDDLLHRERRRRRWRWSIAAAAGLVLLCLTSALAVNAVIARHAAERRQKQAEDLVGFMLGDLDDKLREVNRLEILESVADRVVKYFASLPDADVTDSAIAQRTRAQLKLGAVQRDQGRVEEAIATFKSAQAASEALVRSDPANVEYQKIRIDSYSWLGFVAWSQGRLDDALASFIAARDALLALNARHPDDDDILDRLATSRTNAARVYEVRGKIDLAREEYEKILETYTYLSRRDPKKMEWKTELGYAHNNLGQISLKQGRIEEALHEYVKDRDIKENLYALDPQNNVRREDLASSEAFLSAILLMCGQTDAALTHIQAALRAVEDLLAIDGDSSDWLEKAGSFGPMLGQAERLLGNMEEATRADTKATARLRRIVQRDPGNVVLRRKLATAEIENSRRLVALNQAAAGSAAARSAVDIASKVFAENKDSRDARLALAKAELAYGDAAAAIQDEKAARSAWSAAYALVESDALSSADPAVLDARIQLELRLGNDKDTAAQAQALIASGYREPEFIAALRAHGIELPPADERAQRIASIADSLTRMKQRTQ